MALIFTRTLQHPLHRAFFSKSRLVRGCKGKTFVFVLSFRQLNKVNTNVMLKEYCLYSAFQFHFVFVQSL